MVVLPLKSVKVDKVPYLSTSLYENMLESSRGVVSVNKAMFRIDSNLHLSLKYVMLRGLGRQHYSLQRREKHKNLLLHPYNDQCSLFFVFGK